MLNLDNAIKKVFTQETSRNLSQMIVSDIADKFKDEEWVHFYVDNDENLAIAERDTILHEIANRLGFDEWPSSDASQEELDAFREIFTMMRESI